MAPVDYQTDSASAELTVDEVNRYYALTGEAMPISGDLTTKQSPC